MNTIDSSNEQLTLHYAEGDYAKSSSNRRNRSA